MFPCNPLAHRERPKLYGVLAIPSAIAKFCGKLYFLHLLMKIALEGKFIPNFSESQLDVDSDRYEDDDVTNERHRLYQRGPVEDSLISRNLSKVYTIDSFFLAYRIRVSAYFTWTDNSYLTHVISPRTG